jgi:hypothetical protein
MGFGGRLTLVLLSNADPLSCCFWFVVDLPCDGPEFGVTDLILDLVSWLGIVLCSVLRFCLAFGFMHCSMVTVFMVILSQ